MAYRDVVPIRVNPRGATDTLDATNSAPGAMSALTNLVFDPSTPFCFQCRPAAVDISSFPGFSSPGVVSVAYQLGTRIYGMIASAANPGKDEPFVYDVPTNAFIAVTGITGAKSPATQSTSGDWTPPTMDMMGKYLIVTHPGFPGAAGAYFGWFDLTNPAAPAWDAANTTTHALASVPTAVRQFNNRAYFATGNNLVLTDPLTLAVTNASQVLTVGDSNIITALAPLSTVTTTQAILQGLLVFKSNFVANVTGDPTTNDLDVNTVSSTTGTSSPRSVVSTTEGVRFVANDGTRVIGLNATMSDPNDDIRVPFIHAMFPSRISAAYNSGVYRVCLQNANVVGVPFQEWWLDIIRGGWTGPHTFRQNMAVPYANDFVCFSNAHPAVMYYSEVVQSSTSVFIENGSTLQFIYSSPPLTSLDGIYALSAILTTINMALVSGAAPYTITATDESGGVVSQASVPSPSTNVLWGFFVWGMSIWFGAQYGLRPINIAWTKPLVFTKVLLQVNGLSSLGFKISNMQILYKRLNYVPIP